MILSPEKQNPAKVIKGNKIRILLLEDSKADAELLIHHLRREKLDFEHIVVWSEEDFRQQLVAFEPDLILADYSLPQFSGLDAYRIMKKNMGALKIPFILVTGSISEVFIQDIVKEGVDDYLLKDNLLRLPGAITKVIHKKQLEIEKEKIEKLNTRLSLSNKKLEDAYGDIKNSIHYAQKIQEAVLPDFTCLHKENLRHILIYKPKDILSGDFYWADEKDGNIFIAVADCTGHGVPGALLSMAGHNELNQIINMNNITDPEEILTMLNKRFQKILKQEKTATNDGMDIALCKIIPSTNTLEYAGANRPLYFFRNNTINELKPDKISIGGIQHTHTQFNKQSLQLKKGDRIFMFTDGITDQFDRTDKKKVTRKRFKRLLKDLCVKVPGTLEQGILDFLRSWQGRNQQTDDILLLGIEF